MVPEGLFFLMVAVALLGWICCAAAGVMLHVSADRILVLKNNLEYWRNRATHLQSELLDRLPAALVDPEGARIVPFRGKVK